MENEGDVGYSVWFSNSADKQLKKIKKDGGEMYEKVRSLLIEIVESPKVGSGRPERLKYYGNRDVWSRRINAKDRIVYEVWEDLREIAILQILGHYRDK